MTLTKGDLKKVEELVDNKLDVQKKSIVSEVVSEVADHVDKVFEKYRNDMNEKLDPILKEIQAEPQERAILTNRIEEHEDRITVLEAKVQ